MPYTSLYTIEIGAPINLIFIGSCELTEISGNLLERESKRNFNEGVPRRLVLELIETGFVCEIYGFRSIDGITA